MRCPEYRHDTLREKGYFQCMLCEEYLFDREEIVRRAAADGVTLSDADVIPQFFDKADSNG